MRSGMMLMIGVLTAVVIMIVLFPANNRSSTAAPSVALEHTQRLAPDEKSPPATFEDVAWMVGAWEGEAFGGTFEEVWNPPSNGSMVGFFKLMEDDQIKFYELLVLEEVDGSLVMRVKHFNADFSAWEEKDEHTAFRLAAVEEDAVHFSGISFYRQSNGDIEAYLAMRTGDQVREEKLVYYRRQL